MARNKREEAVSAPVRCKREQWYLVRGRPSDGRRRERTEVLTRFLRAGEVIDQRVLCLRTVAANGDGGELLGWIQSPERATHVQLALAHADQAEWFEEVLFHQVAERDPKCHPLAAVPRWSKHAPPFPIERVVLPPALAGLAELLSPQQVDVYEPTSLQALARRIRGAACVFDPAWVRSLRATWGDLERLAATSWLVVDLQTAWELLLRAKQVEVQLVSQSAPHGIMSARVEYSDVATRGFALQDVFPYATLQPDGGFAARVLRADRAWKRYADEHDFATLLASETPVAKHCGDVLSAARPIGRGELMATDLPGLVAGLYGPLLAPRLAQHALRMHLAGPLDDNVQYWSRWDDGQIVLRDASDLARRYPPLRTAHWAAAGGEVVQLGVALPASGHGGTGRAIMFRTGRIDSRDVHDGIAPEPMIIFMKMLAREARERTAWARRHLHDLTVIWQFDSAVGVRYAANYASAAWLGSVNPRVVSLTRTRQSSPASALSNGSVEVIADDEGLLGDGSFEFQRRLDTRLRGLIQRVARAT